MKDFFNLLFTNKSQTTLRPTIEAIIDDESKVGAKLFPTDQDVTSVKYFFLPDESGHKWYYQQTSPIQSKNFTNSYMVTEFGIEKSSTFFDERQGRMINVSVPVSDVEAQNLLTAAKNYYAEVTGKVYVKAPAPRFRFGTTNDHRATTA